MQRLKRIRRCRLIVLIIAHQPAAEVGRENLRCREMLAREGALTRPAGADEDDQAQSWDGDFHEGAAAVVGMRGVAWLKTAICVGEPRSASSLPMPLSRD